MSVDARSSINSLQTTTIWKTVYALSPTDIRHIRNIRTIWWTDIFDISSASANCRCKMCRSSAIKAATIFLFTSIKLVYGRLLRGSNMADVRQSRNSLGHRCIILFGVRSVLYNPSISSHICFDVRQQWTQYQITLHCSVLKFTLLEPFFNKNLNTQD